MYSVYRSYHISTDCSVLDQANPLGFCNGHCNRKASCVSRGEKQVSTDENLRQLGSGMELQIGAKVRVLGLAHVKGAFILTSDGKRQDWTVDGPHFAGFEMFHIKGSPVDPNRLYASQTSGWFGQLMQRSNDGGKTWDTIGNEFTYDGIPGTHMWYDGTPHPWEFKRVWHVEPSLTDPDTVYAGAEDAALFKSTDGGLNWLGACPACASTIRGSSWQRPVARMCLHTILARSDQPTANLRCHFGRGSFPYRRRRRNLEAHQQGPGVRFHARSYG